MSDLIERLERGDPNAGLDVPLAFGFSWNGRLASDNPTGRWEHPDGRTLPDDNYAGSIDAVLRLLPAWASWELTRSAAGEPTFTRCRLWDWRRGPLMVDPRNEWVSEGNRPLPINIILAAREITYAAKLTAA